MSYQELPKVLGFRNRAHNNKVQMKLETALENKGLIKGIDFISEMAFIRFGKRFYVDIGFPKLKIIVEIDGNSHKTRQEKYEDRQRDKLFSKFNWLVIRFTNEEVENNPDKCVETILYEGQNWY